MRSDVTRDMRYETRETGRFMVWQGAPGTEQPRSLPEVMQVAGCTWDREERAWRIPEGVAAVEKVFEALGADPD